MVGNVHHYQHNAQVVLSSEESDSGVYVFRVEPVIFQGEKEGTCCRSYHIIGGDIGILPR